jgi:hypothetical protein
MQISKNTWVAGGIVLAIIFLFFCKVLWLSSSTFSERFLPMMGRGGSVGSSGEPGYMMDATYAVSDSLAVGAPEFQMKSMMVPPDAYETAGETAANVDQKIIKTGFLSLEVSDVEETEANITALATGKGGFVQDSDMSEREDGTHFGNVTVRVPSAEFESTMNEIKTYAVVVETQSAQGQDITEQYTDLEAQLRNAQAQETEYLKILKQAQRIEDILQVQSYLSGVRSQIESLQGRIQYLENKTSYSTISVGLSEEPTIRVPTKGFNVGSTVREAVQVLVAIAQNLATSLVWLVIVGGGVLLPLGLVVWGMVVLVIKWIHRK